MKKIHYLVKNCFGGKGGLVYPSEIENDNYYTVGNLYILGDQVEEEYIIHAIRDEEILELSLKKIINGFFASVEGIGDFIFYTERVSMQEYTGGNSNIEDRNVLRRLRLSDAKYAEEVCKQHKFYFVGFSDAINS